MLSSDASSTCHMLSFFSELVHTPCRASGLGCSLPDTTITTSSTDKSSSRMNNGSLDKDQSQQQQQHIPSLCDSLLVSEEVISRVLRLIMGSSMLPPHRQNTSSQANSRSHSNNVTAGSQEKEEVSFGSDVSSIYPLDNSASSSSNVNYKSSLLKLESIVEKNSTAASTNTTSSSNSSVDSSKQPQDNSGNNNNNNGAPRQLHESILLSKSEVSHGGDERPNHNNTLVNSNIPVMYRDFVGEACYTEVVKQQVTAAARGVYIPPPPSYESLGHVVLRSHHDKKGVYDKKLALKWANELKRAAGASGNKVSNHNQTNTSASTPSNQEDNEGKNGFNSNSGVELLSPSSPPFTVKNSPSGGSDYTAEQCAVDERACRFICSCIQDPIHAENEVPKLVKWGIVSGLAKVAARWHPANRPPLGGDSQVWPTAASYSKEQNVSGKVVEEEEEEEEAVEASPLLPPPTPSFPSSLVDGRLAHHYAVNALIYIAMSCRGTFVNDIALYGSFCALSLKERLLSMRSFAKKKHSTDYSEQTAMTAIESVLKAWKRNQK
jgi:hypothetical protein